MKSLIIITSLILIGAFISGCSTSHLMKDCLRTYGKDGKQTEKFVCRNLKPWD